VDAVFLPWWQRRCRCVPASGDDAYRPLAPGHGLAMAKVHHDYTFRFAGARYAFERRSITAGLRGSPLRLEQRPDGSLRAASRTFLFGVDKIKKNA
jgi:hypothetical protein